MAPGLAAAELLLKAAQTREESDGRIDAAFDRIYSRSIGEAMGMLPDRDGPMSGASQKGEVSRAFSDRDFPCHSGLCDDAGARSRHVV
jgi:hypothetical protein